MNEFKGEKDKNMEGKRKQKTNLKELRKSAKGITLIALVITIIVLLILAGVTIATLTGDNGILTQASRAKEENEKAEIIEQIRLDISDKQIENQGSIDEYEFYEILKKYGTISADETILTTTKGSYEILISDIYSGTLASTERKSNNLVNLSALKYGIFTYGGEESNNEKFISTDKIEIEENTSYISNRNIQTINYYNEDEAYISMDNGGNYTIINQGFTTPKGAKYMVISFRNDDYPTITNEKNMESVWVGKNEINNMVCEPFGIVNYKSGIPNKLDKDRIFYDTVLHSNMYFTYATESYGNARNLAFIKPIANVPFYINGIESLDLVMLDENLQIVHTLTSDEYDSSYIIFDINKYPNAKYLEIVGLISDKENVEMEYYYESTGENVLDNKIIVGYGDSLTQGSSTSNKTWLGKVAQYFNIQQVNRGIGGTTVTPSTSTAWVTLDGEYLASEIQGDFEPTEEHITINSSMSHDDRILTIPTNADIVLFFGGTNGMDEESYRTTLDKIKTRAPNAKIICMNITYRQTEDEDESIAEDYTNRRNIITQLANEYGYPVIQLKELMGVDKTNASQYMADKVHFKNAGYSKIAIAVINQLKQSIQDGYIK